MNIYAKEGDKIIFNNEQGTDLELEYARKYLTPGAEYTVEQTKAYGWHTDVYLKEVPGIYFNSVIFDDKGL